MCWGGMEMKDIPQFKTFAKVEPVEKGWSQDKKYYVETINGKRLLLRISDLESFESKRAEFDVMLKIAQLGIPMSMPLDFGKCCDQVYTLLTWVDGDDAEIVLPSLTPERQYELGLEAGRYLRRIHTIPAPADLPSWEERFNRKIDRNINNYKNCDLRFKHDDKVIQYLQDNRHLLVGREQALNHGDYHVGNMVLSPDGNLGIIDFNRWDYGDPWDEFNRIVFSANVSKDFAAGTIDGYFDKDVPDLFFRLMALYIASNTLSSLPWAIPFGKKEVEVMLRNINETLDYYQGFDVYVPTWYRTRD